MERSKLAQLCGLRFQRKVSGACPRFHNHPRHSPALCRRLTCPSARWEILVGPTASLTPPTVETPMLHLNLSSILGTRTIQPATRTPLCLISSPTIAAPGIRAPRSALG